MCGLAGVFHYADADAVASLAAVDGMGARLAHRGPDADGHVALGPLALAHRRLSVLDLSDAGHQPMASQCRRFWLAYNGEVYNHRALRAALCARFRGTSDTETLLEFLMHHGARELASLAGIFAFAFYDQQTRRLLLVRDPMGVKPLYYHDDGKRIVFASEIKALCAYPGVPRAIDLAAVNDYVHFHTPTFERTLFSQIKQVQPAECLHVGAAGVRAHTYWHPGTEDFAPVPLSRRIDTLRDTLRTVVHEQTAADVPVGAYFSGGLDSSSIAAYAADTDKAGLRCFGIRFAHPNVIDEGPYQRVAAHSLDLELAQTTVQSGQLADDLARLMWFQDQPVVGPSLLPMYYVSRMAARHVKVCLGGQGADEVFGGYARYALAAPWLALRASPRSAAAPAAGDSARGSVFKQLANRRNLRRLGISLTQPSCAGRYFANFAHVPEHTWQRLAPGATWLSRRRARVAFEDFLRHSPAQQMGNKILHWDMRTYLTGLFQQEDRMSMANGIESRLPLADPRLVQLSFATPFELKVRQGATKWLLRQSVASRLPACVVSRRKVGFDTPVPAWLQGPCRGMVRDILSSTRARQRGLWHPTEVQRLLDRPHHPAWFDVVWKLLSLEVWAQIFIDSPAAL